MLDNKALTELVETVIRRQFSDAAIHAMAVEPDVDHDGDAILRVTVLKDGSEQLDLLVMNVICREQRPRRQRAAPYSFTAPVSELT